MVVPASLRADPVMMLSPQRLSICVVKSRHGGVPERETDWPPMVRLVTVLTESYALPLSEIGETSRVPSCTMPPRGGLVPSTTDVGAGGVSCGASGEDGVSSEQLHAKREMPATSTGANRRKCCLVRLMSGCGREIMVL